MNIHFIIHESFEAPAAIEVWAKNKHHKISYTNVYLYEKYPEKIDEIDFLIVMGGPQSPDSTLEEYPYFEAKTEMEFIKKVAEADKKVLGVCLGAQMIGQAFGAKVERSPNREIGVFNIKLTDEAKNHPYFSTLPSTFSSGHWHGDMPGLTDDALVLAYSEGCPKQIIKYSSKVFAFQCHLEFTSESMKTMIENSGEELEQFKNLPFVETAEELLQHNYLEMNKILSGFLDYMESM